MYPYSPPFLPSFWLLTIKFAAMAEDAAMNTTSMCSYGHELTFPFGKYWAVNVSVTLWVYVWLFRKSSNWFPRWLQQFMFLPADALSLCSHSLWSVCWILAILICGSNRCTINLHFPNDCDWIFFPSHLPACMFGEVSDAFCKFLLLLLEHDS